MDAWTSLIDGEQYGVWVAMSVAYLLFAFVFYPVRYFLKQQKFRRQISTHLVTSVYNLPTELSPAELSYLFSPSVGKRQLYASLMQLTNDGVLHSSVEKGKLQFTIGPRVDTKMPLSSAYLLDILEQSGGALYVEGFTEGNMSYKLPNTHEKVDGSKNYVFWWVVREGLRQRGVIVKRPIEAYFTVILKSHIKLTLLSLFAVGLLHAALMSGQGEISLDATGSLLLQTVFWFGVFFIPAFIVSFMSVRIRGKFLGRDWILTDKKQRLLNQFDAFREYVRLVHEGNVAFESDEAQRQAELRVLPFAVALGYAKPPRYYTEQKNHTA